ncbi:unnamed protein product [Pleuronectes platessa]|uniref:Uncharacterized protein n=1 Tax=Pleuronectes platessa TaxID=8262 RepID=A0A9N7V028_PLEPL|nr:unnamed protein product [Pleuronectes platessa]
MSSGCWLHVSGSLLGDVSVFVYAVLHVAAHPGSSGDLAEKQSLWAGLASAAAGRRLLGGGLDPGCTRAAHCEAGGAPADFKHLTAGHVSPAQGSPRLQVAALFYSSIACGTPNREASDWEVGGEIPFRVRSGGTMLSES